MIRDSEPEMRLQVEDRSGGCEDSAVHFLRLGSHQATAGTQELLLTTYPTTHTSTCIHTYILCIVHTYLVPVGVPGYIVCTPPTMVARLHGSSSRDSLLSTS